MIEAGRFHFPSAQAKPTIESAQGPPSVDRELAGSARYSGQHRDEAPYLQGIEPTSSSADLVRPARNGV